VSGQLDSCDLGVFRSHCFLLLLLRSIFNEHSQMGARQAAPLAACPSVNATMQGTQTPPPKVRCKAGTQSPPVRSPYLEQNRGKQWHSLFFFKKRRIWTAANLNSILEWRTAASGCFMSFRTSSEPRKTPPFPPSSLDHPLFSLVGAFSE